MSITNILTLSPDFDLKESIAFQTEVMESEHGNEERMSAIDEGLREYKLITSNLTATQMQTIWDFYIARQGATDDFLLKIVTEFQVTDEPVGNADGSSTSYLLHHFPVDATANHSIKLNGVAASYTLSNDYVNEKSYVIFNSAPVLGDVITATYEYYFRVRFKNDNFTRELMNNNLLSAGIELVEVRWNTYFPFAGNSSSSSSSSSAGNIVSIWYPVSGTWPSGASGGSYQEDSGTQQWDGVSNRRQRTLIRILDCAQVTTQMTIARMFVYLNAPPGIGKKRVFTLYLNDQPTDLKLTLSGLQRSGNINTDINCQNGDFVYLREDKHNSPAKTNINIGFAVKTNDAHRCPILGPSHTAAYSPLYDSAIYGFFGFFGYPAYASDPDDLTMHSMITTPGQLRNLQARNYRIARPNESLTVNLSRKVGVNKLEEFPIEAVIPQLQIRAEDPLIEEDIIVRTGFFSFETQHIAYRNSADLQSGDMVVWSGPFGTMPNMAAIDFIPFYPKESNHGFSGDQSYPTLSSSRYYCIHGFANWAGNSEIDGFTELNGNRPEAYTLFATPGTIKNMTAWDGGASNIQPGAPVVLVLRKNGVDTNVQITLSYGNPKVTISDTLHVNAGDRISIRTLPTALVGSSNQWHHFAWTFVSDNAGEWPMFMTRTTI